MLREWSHPGPFLADIGLVVEHPGRFRVEAAEERGARWPADRVLAIGSQEAGTARGQPVHRRCPDVTVAGGADVGVQVVTDDEENIRRLRSRPAFAGRHWSGCKEGQENRRSPDKLHRVGSVNSLISPLSFR